MDFVRTPDSRFENLPGYDFKPNYAEVDGLRMHYVDEGPSDKHPVLMLHGEPSWSFLYRKMIPIIAAAGHRTIAPDLVGFGRSDKPTQREAYSYAAHIEWMRCLLFDHLDLRNITLVCQDWGGLIGLRLVAEHPERFSRVVAANTLLPTGDQTPGPMFDMWKKMSQEMPSWAPLFGGTEENPTPEDVRAAYDAPFPDETYKAGSRQFPLLVPVSPEDPAAEANRQAWAALKKFEKPFLIAFSDGDPITGDFRDLFLSVPGSKGQPHTTIKGAGHFLQEDNGEDLASVVNDFIAKTT
ncbi:MAG: haloalkane dehalogenase [Halioglobus sp.]